MDLLRIAARVAAGPERFRWRKLPPGPGDWSPDPAVLEEGTRAHEALKDGDVVTWTGESRTDVERDWTDDGPEDVELEFREVVTESGLTGWVAWHPWNGTSGFEPA